MRGLIPVLLAAVALGGCATLTPPAAGTNSSLITGELKLDVSGIGTAPNGADGFLNTNVLYACALIIRNEASGKTYELRTAIPSGFFTLPNAEPGSYRLVQLWAQVKTSNGYVTLTSSFDKSPTFDVLPGHVANLGVNRWDFSFDLTRSASTNSFVFSSDFPGVAAALLQADPRSGWTGLQSDQVAFSREASATPLAIALQPRGGRIVLP